jgi:CRP/FNR family transcriptional regulator, cyclic AMP receptor protein
VRLGKDSKAAAMAKVPLFARCSKKELQQIAQLADEVDLPPEKTLTKEGTRGREFFVILEGTTDVIRGGKKVASMKGGDFFGEIALVTDVQRTATVKTTSPLHALVINDREFRELLRTSADIQGKILQAVAQRLAASI